MEYLIPFSDIHLLAVCQEITTCQVTVKENIEVKEMMSF